MLKLQIVRANQKDENGSSMIAVAIRYNAVKSVEFLLKDASVSLTEVDREGFSAVEHAFALGRREIIQMIRELRPEALRSVRRQHLSRYFSSGRFNKIEAGEFDMRDQKGALHHVALTEPFEMMSTLVTQRMWALVMGRNPSIFKDGSVLVTPEGVRIEMRPNHPVESINLSLIQKYIRRLNALSDNRDPLLLQIFPDHREGFHYALPTEAEWEYVLRDRGRKSISEMETAISPEELLTLAWLGPNSGGSTHAVGLKKPTFVDGQPMYDLLGNVAEYTPDVFADLKGGINPKGPRAKGEWDKVVVRGRSWLDISQKPDFNAAVARFRMGPYHGGPYMVSV